ncbi:centrosomal protein of 170 kDa [Rhinophrynus dorsalis]
MSLTSWFLVSSGGTRHRLPREMIFVGRDDCELMLQSRSVDKQHAVVNYDSSTDEHLVKDLGSLNGTFVNDVRIPEQTYITLKLEDKLRFGYDILFITYSHYTNLFTVVRGEMRVPEEALKHEKFTSQLHFSQRQSDIEGSKLSSSKVTDVKVSDVSSEVLHKVVDVMKSEDKAAVDMSSMPRGTPLYGQPSWWGDEDSGENGNTQNYKESKLHESGASGYCKQKKDGEEAITENEESLYSLCREPSYFEIPTKEFQQKTNVEETANHEIPTKDSQCSHVLGAGHASFTIEFDDSSPGKVTIKDHVTKFTSDHRQKTKKPLPSCAKDLSGLQTEMLAAESKVADWLAQNNPPRLRKEAPEEDAKSIKSDIPVYLKKLKGNKHEDGTQSDYENSGVQKRFSKSTLLDEHLRPRHIEQKKLDIKFQTSGKLQETTAQTAFMIEFFDEDHPRKRRSYSFTQNAGVAGPEAPYPIPQSRIEKVKATSVDPKGLAIGFQSGSSSHRVIHSTQHAKLLLKQKSEEPCTSLLLSQNVLLRSSGSLGHRPSKKRVVADEVAIPSVTGIDKDHKDDQYDKAELDMSSIKDTEAHKTVKESTATSERKRWVSQWASLASNNNGHDQENGRVESDTTLSVENDADISESGMSIRSNGSATSLTSQNDRIRRTLPQLPKEDTSAEISRTKTSHNRSEIGEKQDTELQEKETPTHVSKKEKMCVLDTRGVAKTGQPVDGGSIKLETKQREKNQRTSGKLSSSMQTSVQACKAKEDQPRQASCALQNSLDAIPNQTSNKTEVVSGNHTLKSVESSKKESTKPLVRQGSFTIDKPSTNVPIELIPRINKQSGSSPTFAFASANNARERSNSVDTDSSMDTTLLLKDTEAVMAFLEAKLRDETKTDEGPETPSYTQDNSISPESDVDTASTISLVTGEAEKKCPQKRKSFSSLYKERASTTSPSKDISKSSSTVTREKVEKKSKTRVPEVGIRNDTRKVFHTSERNRQPSLDLSNDDQTSSLPHSAISDILSSDQETYSGKSVPKSKFTSTDELLHSKSSKDKCTSSKTSPANKSVTLPRPRPTRTSLLRRSRLGDASDTEIGDADKASVASEVSTTSSTSKPPTGKKNLSRLDLLAQPRRTRLGSLSARSDSEATISRSPVSSRTPESVLRSGQKTIPQADGKGPPRARANSISRLSDAKTKTVAPMHTSPPVNSRWRRIPPEYASTSEDEFGSNRNSLKPTRLRASPSKNQRLQSTGTSPVIPPAALNAPKFKHRIIEQEDYIRDWTAHREEIARISQDLALIAREINDVAGEIDSVTSSGTAPSTTVSTAATTPGSAIDTREELVDRVFDESLNFRKIPPLNQSSPAEASFRTSDSKSQQKETSEPQGITRRKTWSRDEAMGDSLLLSSVFQFSRKIRQGIDKTANKIRILFKDKERNWDEIEQKLRAESEIPVLKTSCVEILSILQELKRVEKQLQVINAMIDPDGTLEALNILGFSSSVSSVEPKQSSLTHTSRSSSSARSQADIRSSRPNRSVSTEFDRVESDPDFSIRFNRFNPDGKEDTTLHE